MDAGVSLVILIVVFYFIPTLTASHRNTENQGMIKLLNLAFGWTILGWIAALIWAIVEKPKPNSAEPHGERR